MTQSGPSSLLVSVANIVPSFRWGSKVRRREFITLVGAAAAWPMAARAQQLAMPVIGFLDPRSPDALADRLRAFHRGLKDIGYIERENVGIEYRWAENQMDRLPALAAELVRLRRGVIISPGELASTLAAKQATTIIPIVFAVADDPVRLGLVASLGRPGGNLTGINFFAGEVTAKRLEILREMVPTANRVAVLVNPANAANVETTSKEAEAAARTLGLKIRNALRVLYTSGQAVTDGMMALFVKNSAFLPKPYTVEQLGTMLAMKFDFRSSARPHASDGTDGAQRV